MRGAGALNSPPPSSTYPSILLHLALDGTNLATCKVAAQQGVVRGQEAGHPANVGVVHTVRARRALDGVAELREALVGDDVDELRLEHRQTRGVRCGTVRTREIALGIFDHALAARARRIGAERGDARRFLLENGLLHPRAYRRAASLREEGEEGDKLEGHCGAWPCLAKWYVDPSCFGRVLEKKG